ncbi:hypothetical protein N7493_004210 [Penicillium malachiteum]|uniref:Uncharacterized protein n=1 Tax=Penicillium malachiteum TaxID=1324776 RepID=A0AAD6HR67_9EURO|nr:hypothetical protein N7493_004210 [Penicillium malachiteum]
MAIHEFDFQVELPAANDQTPFLPSGESDCPGPVAQDHMMDYFLEVIRFSHIVGQVIRVLYRPSQIDLSPDQILQSASDLDKRLIGWKAKLPRHLRFDLGHTFEKSMSFKRQRNMLAVKFHHLRALVHRPFLCLPLLQMNNQSFMNLLIQDKERISEAESICVHEAQQTAHLLHNVVDERSLVHDFPWWQMISCLICASSILFVAESFYNNNNNPAHNNESSQSLREDAGTCLKVFEALSANSAAAKKAADILEGLSQMRRSTEEVVPTGSTGLVSTSQPQVVPLPPRNNTAYTEQPGAEYMPNAVFPSQIAADQQALSDWPSEISSTMEWSIRFLDYPQFQGGEFQYK